MAGEGSQTHSYHQTSHANKLPVRLLPSGRIRIPCVPPLPTGVAAVVAIPCVGDAAYLQQQMATLDEASGAVGTLPDVLDLPLALPGAGPKPGFWAKNESINFGIVFRQMTQMHPDDSLHRNCAKLAHGPGPGAVP